MCLAVAQRIEHLLDGKDGRRFESYQWYAHEVALRFVAQGYFYCVQIEQPFDYGKCSGLNDTNYLSYTELLIQPYICPTQCSGSHNPQLIDH